MSKVNNDITRQWPDALFSCVYRWINGRVIKKEEADVAMKWTKPDTPMGALAIKMRSMVFDDKDPGWLVDKGFQSDKNPEKAKENRKAVVLEFISSDELVAVLADSARINRLFPPALPAIKRTRLPLSIGSAGFDARQDYTIKGYLPSNSLCSIFGPSGSYKSFLAVSWACHIATGKAWAGKRVAQGAVLYIVGEGGVGVPRRVKAWEMAHNHNENLNSLYLVNRPVFPVRNSEVEEVLIACKQVEAECGMPVVLVVFDTLARCFGGSDENDAKDMGAFIEGCDNIKQKTGATVLVVHHSGKDEAKGARGSSAFRAALDAEFNVKREGEGHALVLNCTKMKDAEEPERHAYDLRKAELFNDEDDELITSLVVMDSPRAVKEVDPALEGVTKLTDNHVSLWQSVRSRTAKGEPCTKAIIKDDLKALGIDTNNFYRWLSKLEKDGVILLDGEKITPLRNVSD
ncbi:TPA: helicase RepA family protein [Yersinia enterocolitica]